MVNTSDNLTPGSPLPSGQQPFYSRPLIFWGGLWIVLLTVGGVAAKGLLSPGPVEHEKSGSEFISQRAAEPESFSNTSNPSKIQPTPSTLPTFTRTTKPSPTVKVAPPPPKAPQPSTGVPLWLYGAIAFGCTAGLGLIYLGFQRSVSSRKPVKRTGTKSKPVPTAKVRKKPPASPQKRRTAPPVARTQSPVVPEPVYIMEPTVTVLSPEESHPLDWGEQTLADMMDLRKRQSLSSLLRK